MHVPLIFVAALAVFHPARAKEPRPRVVVLPFTAMAASEADCRRLRSHLTGILNKLFEVQNVEAKTTDKAVRRLCGQRPAWWDCLGKDENLFELGARLKANTVVVGRLAAIGQRRVLKLRLADVPAGRVFTEVVNIPAGQEDTVLSRFALANKKRFGEEPPPPTPKAPFQAAPTQERAWYEKWEVWTIVGSVAAVAAGAVLFATMYSPGDDGRPWDFHRTLP